MEKLVGLLIGLLFVSTPVLAKVQVFACEPEWQALAEAIGGEYVRVHSATTAFQDPHYIEARPSLIAKTRNADLLFCTGAELEIGWLPLLLRQSGNSAIQENAPGYFLAASQVERLDVPTQLDRSQGDIHAAGNPHVHWDPYRLLKIAAALARRLGVIDPDHAETYQQRYESFASEWRDAIQSWETQVMSLKGKRAIVYHQYWRYLLNWLEIEVAGDLEPKPGLPPTSAHLADLLNRVKDNKPDFILVANYQNDKGAQWLSQKTGIPVIRLPFTVGGSKLATNFPSLYSEVLSALGSAQ